MPIIYIQIYGFKLFLKSKENLDFLPSSASVFCGILTHSFIHSDVNICKGV